jgi:hypothetical protein
MSAGAFELGRYQTNEGYVLSCRAQPETKQLTINSTANAYPAGSVDAGFPTMKLSNGTREFGIKPRTVTVQLTADGSGETAEYREGRQYRVPVFQQSVWDGYTKTETGTYLGIACILLAKSPEIIN